MGDSPIVALHPAADLLVRGVVAGRGIVEGVAVLVMTHIADDICLVMIDIYGLGVFVAGREISPVPGRVPGAVMRHQKVCIYLRPCNEYGLDDERRTVNVRRADNLDVAGGTDVGHLGDHSRHVLIHVGIEHGLNHENVGSAVHCLQNAQIIHISVLVEVEIGEHI